MSDRLLEVEVQAPNGSKSNIYIPYAILLVTV